MKRIICIGIAWVGLCWAAKASPVTFTLSGSGSGSLGGSPFLDAAFIITSIADTTNITQPRSNVFSVPDITATVFVFGLGTAAFTNPTVTFVNLNVHVAGINAISRLRDILDVGNDLEFSNYDLSYSLGPVTGTPFFNPGFVYQTTVGGFSLTSVSSATFQAVVVPEPSTFEFFGVSLIGLVLCRGKHKIIPPDHGR